MNYLALWLYRALYHLSIPCFGFSALQLHCFGSRCCHSVSFSHCRQLLSEEKVLNLKVLSQSKVDRRNYRLDAIFKRWSLTAVLKVLSVGAVLMYIGREFLEDGGSDALSPRVWSSGVMSEGWKWQIEKNKQEYGGIGGQWGREGPGYGRLCK